MPPSTLTPLGWVPGTLHYADGQVPAQCDVSVFLCGMWARFRWSSPRGEKVQDLPVICGESTCGVCSGAPSTWPRGSWRMVGWYEVAGSVERAFEAGSTTSAGRADIKRDSVPQGRVDSTGKTGVNGRVEVAERADSRGETTPTGRAAVGKKTVREGRTVVAGETKREGCAACAGETEDVGRAVVVGKTENTGRAADDGKTTVQGRVEGTGEPLAMGRADDVGKTARGRRAGTAGKTKGAGRESDQEQPDWGDIRVWDGLRHAEAGRGEDGGLYPYGTEDWQQEMARRKRAYEDLRDDAADAWAWGPGPWEKP